MPSTPARLVKALLVALLMAVAWSTAALAQGPVVEPPFTALADDAARYTARYGVTPAEAQARLRAQAAIGGLVDRLRARWGDRLAGIAIEHVPAFRIVVLATGGDAVPDAVETLAGLPVRVVTRTDARAGAAAIRAAIVAHQADLRDRLFDPPGLGIDARTGAMIVTVSARDADAGPGVLEGDFAALTGVPVEIAVPGIGQDTAQETTFSGLSGLPGLSGGGRLDAVDPAAHRRYACTAGFVVTDGTRAALSTAAHCPDAIGAGGVALPMIGAWGAGTQDVQLHDSPVPLAPAFRVGTGATTVVRPVTGMGTRARTVAGQFVCHQGFRDGESCAEVISADFAPPGDLCAGPCPPDWVAVAGPDCAHGDSGGPVFEGTVALGLMKGASFRDGRCSLYYYMPIEALPPGWRVLTGGETLPPRRADPDREGG